MAGLESADQHFYLIFPAFCLIIFAYCAGFMDSCFDGTLFMGCVFVSVPGYDVRFPC